MFTNWVNGGGNLIAMRPDKKLAGLLGLTDAGTTLADGYLQINTTAAPGAGIASATMQYHSTARIATVRLARRRLRRSIPLQPRRPVTRP